MKKDLVEIVCILDCSGSMSSIKNDAIGEFNSFIEEQGKLPGEATVTLINFNSEYKVIYENENLKNIPKLNQDTYQCSSLTALLDAVGKTIDDIGKRLDNTPEENKPEQVIFAIMTDGQENDSKTYSYENIKEKIEHQKEKYNWQFIFLGANIDVFSEGNSLGIDKGLTYAYAATGDGIRNVYSTLSDTVTSFRSNNNS